MDWMRTKIVVSGALTIAALHLFPLQTLRADIIDSIEELEKPKKQTDPKPSDKKKNETSKESPESQLPLLEVPPELPRPPGGSTPKSSGKGLKRNDRRKVPIHLQSEGTSTYSQNGAMVHLQKNVVITQDDIRLQADEAKVALQAGKEANAVSSVEMIGKVSMARYSKDPNERISARGDRAVFNNSEQIVTLEGNARLWRDGHLIKGDRIVYEIITGMIKVDRVQGVVQPEKAGK